MTRIAIVDDGIRASRCVSESFVQLVRGNPVPAVPLLDHRFRADPRNVAPAGPRHHRLEVDVEPDDVLPMAGEFGALEKDAVDHHNGPVVDGLPRLGERHVVERVEDGRATSPAPARPERRQQEIAEAA